MDTQDLRRAYADFARAAQRHAPFATPAQGGWTPEMVLAHVIVSDRLIAEAAGRIMAGESPSFDNRASQSEPYLTAIIHAAGDWEGLLALVQRTGDELVALASQMTEEQASTPIPARIYSDGELIFDRSVPASTLVRVPADLHLRAHLEQLGAAQQVLAA